MGIVKGLKNISGAIDKNSGGGEKSGVSYLKLADGEQVKIRFLQELDADSPGYNEQAGLGFLAVEHQKPGDFKVRALCSMDDEGKCWACEQHNKNWKAGWRPKVKLYINVLVTRANGEQEVKVLSQGNGPKSVTPWLLEYAGDVGSLTDKTFRMKRTGAGQTDTAYMLTPGANDLEKYDPTQHELFDLNLAVKEIAYDDQPEYFGGGSQDAAVVATTTGGSDSEDW